MFLLTGVVYLPALIVTGALTVIVQLVPFVSAIVGLAGKASGTSLFLSVFIGSFSNTAAFIVVNAVVAVYLRDERRGVPAAVDALRSAWEHRRALVRAFGRSFVIVFVLLASFVGAPWGNPTTRPLPVRGTGGDVRRARRTIGAGAQLRAGSRSLVPHRPRRGCAELRSRVHRAGRRADPPGRRERHPALGLLDPRVARVRLRGAVRQRRRATRGANGIMPARAVPGECASSYTTGSIIEVDGGTAWSPA